MVTISLCMIVKDEEALLPRCLESIQGLVEEVIVVDTGSSDRTVELAQQAGAQFDGHGCAGGGDGLTGGQTGGVLVDLHGGHTAAHAYDLANQTLITHVHHVHHGQSLAADDGDNRAVDALDNILAHSIILTTNR